MPIGKTQPESARCSGRQHQHLQGKLLRLQSQRIAATNQFLAASERYASAAACHQATVELIDLIIDKWPDAPLFASMLVDKLMAGDEQLQAALMQELG